MRALLELGRPLWREFSRAQVGLMKCSLCKTNDTESARADRQARTRAGNGSSRWPVGLIDWMAASDGQPERASDL